MMKIIILFLCISLSLSDRCVEEENTLYQSPIEIIKCLYNSPIITKDVIELVELVQKQEYITIISYLIEKYSEIRQEILKCLESPKILKLTGDNERNEWYACEITDVPSCKVCMMRTMGWNEQKSEIHCGFTCLIGICQDTCIYSK